MIMASALVLPTHTDKRIQPYTYTCTHARTHTHTQAHRHRHSGTHTDGCKGTNSTALLHVSSSRLLFTPAVQRRFCPRCVAAATLQFPPLLTVSVLGASLQPHFSSDRCSLSLSSVRRCSHTSVPTAAHCLCPRCVAAATLQFPPLLTVSVLGASLQPHFSSHRCSLSLSSVRRCSHTSVPTAAHCLCPRCVAAATLQFPPLLTVSVLGASLQPHFSSDRCSLSLSSVRRCSHTSVPTAAHCLCPRCVAAATLQFPPLLTVSVLGASLQPHFSSHRCSLSLPVSPLAIHN